MGPSLHVTWSFSLEAFNILSLLYIFSVLIMCQRYFLFCSSLFGVLYASCTLTSISFFRVDEFSFMILLKILFVLLACVFLLLCTYYS